MLSYNDPNSHGLLYNIYCDRLLNLGFVPQAVYDMQSTFYRSVQLEFGVALDTRHTWTKSDWEMFAAAVADQETKTMFISKVRKWIDATTTDRAMTDLYDASTGRYPEGGPTFVARPVMGGLFALLALPKTNTTTTTTTTTGSTPGPDSSRPACPSCKEQTSGALERANFGRTGLWRLDGGRRRGSTGRTGSISSGCSWRLRRSPNSEGFQRAWPQLWGAWSNASFPSLFATIIHWLQAR
ncbi:glutaminase GtaA [Magnaporthiopsis poae ATCC 64411]|uniref:Glutaminase GtaA n=1 Tax=Magnaporthiopsis poae (strain ATCC 64411 / 73-15) TaxID=644358 RepID=A0A0C4DZG5_MAGP6|nr:glutaminase GtaA [Magnaporthiopsis poae ATCC 64411]